MAFVGANLTITARPISVTADAQSRTYGDPDPVPLTYHVNTGSLAFSDAFTGALTRASGEGVGTYAISQGSLALSSNYSLTFVGANLIVTVRSITVTADAQSKVYGETDPALTYLITNGSLAFSDAFTGALTRAGGENVGTYTISQGSLALSSNYALTFGGADLTITARPITVTADNKTKVLNAPDPALTYQITDGTLVAGDGFSGALTRAAGEIVGPYAIQLGTLALGANYHLTFNPGQLSIVYASASTACLGSTGHTILQPINRDGSSLWKAGSTVPAKFRVCDANGASVGTPGVVRSFFLVQRIAGTVTATVEDAVASTTPDAAFRWDPSAQQWIFNITTKGMTSDNTYAYAITLNDGSTIGFSFGLK